MFIGAVDKREKRPSIVADVFVCWMAFCFCAGGHGLHFIPWKGIGQQHRESIERKQYAILYPSKLNCFQVVIPKLSKQGKAKVTSARRIVALANWVLASRSKSLRNVMRLLFAASSADKATLACALVVLAALHLAPCKSTCNQRSTSNRRALLLYEVSEHKRIDYFVDKNSSQLIGFPAKDVRSFWKKMKDLLSSYFLPDNSKHSVSDDYFWFTTFHFLQNVVSCCIGVISTQQLLRAVGISTNQGIGNSASLNWVLKDGIGRLGAILFGTLLGNRFDADPKRWRLWGDMLYAMGIGTEMVSPYLSHYFLLIASLANMVKATSYMLRLPTTAAIRRTFAQRENFGDISARANSQEVLSNLIGTFLGIGLSMLMTCNRLQLSIAYIIYFILFFWLNYLGVKSLQLRTLNLYRSLLLGWSYWKTYHVLTVAEANRRENVLLPSKLSRISCVSIGVPLKHMATSGPELVDLLKRYQHEKYLLTIRNGQVRIIFHIDASVKDELQAILQAAYLTQVPGQPSSSLLDSSYQAAKEHLELFIKELRAKGWKTEEFLHSGAQRYRAFWSHEVCKETLEKDSFSARALQSDIVIF